MQRRGCSRVKVTATCGAALLGVVRWVARVLPHSFRNRLLPRRERARPLEDVAQARQCPLTVRRRDGYTARASCIQIVHLQSLVETMHHIVE